MISSTAPGTSGSGSVCEWRWVRFRMPAVTCADVPSGATSVSRTTAVAMAPRPREMQDDPRDAEDLDGVRERLRACTSDRAPRRAEVAREAVLVGRRRPRTGRRACRRPGDGRIDRATRQHRRRRPSDGRPAAPTHRRPRSRIFPAGGGYASPARHRPGASPGTARFRVLAFEPGDGGPSSVPSGSPSAERSKKRTISWSSSMFGLGFADDGQPWTQLPTMVRLGAAHPGLHPQRRVDVRLDPATDVQDGGLDRVVVWRE